MSSRPKLLIAPCDSAAAKYAVEHWHYSRLMPRFKNVYYGVWENDRFIGAVIFGNGCGRGTDGRKYGLAQSFEVAELVRVALDRHIAPVTRIVAIAIRLLRKNNPGLRLLISFADPRHGHHGGIYQAGNWIYTGESTGTKVFVDKNGREYHTRVACAKNRRGFTKDQAVTSFEPQPKHRYLMPLDEEIMSRIELLRQPYPKRVPAGGPGRPFSVGGSTPTHTLQTSL